MRDYHSLSFVDNILVLCCLACTKNISESDMLLQCMLFMVDILPLTGIRLSRPGSELRVFLSYGD